MIDPIQPFEKIKNLGPIRHKIIESLMTQN